MNNFQKDLKFVKDRINNSKNVVQIIEAKKSLDSFIAKYIEVISPMDVGFIQICRELKASHDEKFIKLTNASLTL